MINKNMTGPKPNGKKYGDIGTVRRDGGNSFPEDDKPNTVVRSKKTKVGKAIKNKVYKTKK
jgi:hypothetical protein